MHFTAKINSLKPHIDEVLVAEAVARFDRIAEMEAIKAQNIIQHWDEIKARPSETSFLVFCVSNSIDRFGRIISFQPCISEEIMHFAF